MLIRMTMMTTISHRKVAKLMSQYNDQNSDAEMEVTEMSWPDLQKVLEDDKFDLVIMNLAGLLMDAFTSRQLCSEKYVVLLPRDHPLTRFDTLRLDQLSGQNSVDCLTCEMRQVVLQTCESSGIELYAQLRSEREDWVQSMVAGGVDFASQDRFVKTSLEISKSPRCLGENFSNRFRNSTVLQLARTGRK